MAFADVHDPEGYKLYVAENAKAFRKYGGRFLTRGGRNEAPEGKPRPRAVVIEFPTYQAALDCYRSAEYAKAMALRQGKALMDLSIVEGYDGPEPADTDDDHPFLEKKMGHKPYGGVPRFGKIAIWLVSIAVACGLILYFAARFDLIR